MRAYRPDECSIPAVVTPAITNTTITLSLTLEEAGKLKMLANNICTRIWVADDRVRLLQSFQDNLWLELDAIKIDAYGTD